MVSQLFCPRPYRSACDDARSRSTAAHRRGSGHTADVLHEGGDLLAGGCAYCTIAPPTWSTPIPPPVAPDPRAVASGCATEIDTAP